MSKATSSSTALHRHSPLIRPFYPALDGLRALAILAILSLHFGWQFWWTPALRWGWVGVDLFFVLSGFLITGILFDSLGRPHFFRVFYTRRALRIFPLYYGFWLLILLLTPFFHFQWNRYVLSMVVYLGNLFGASVAHPAPSVLLYRSPFHPGEQHGLSFGPFWSLCVEEQFYLVWPAVVFLLRSRKALLQVCIAAIVLCPFLRAAILYRDPRFFTADGLYVNTFSRLDTLLIGGALALWLRGATPEPATLRRWSGVVALACPALLAALTFGRRGYGFSTYSIPVIPLIGYTLVGLASASLLLLAIDPGSVVFRLLRWKPLTRMGRVSYGMYFLHAPFVEYMAAKSNYFRLHHMGLLSPVFAIALTYWFAQLSFRYFESPFLRLKERFAERPGAIADPPPFGVQPHRESRLVPGQPSA